MAKEIDSGTIIRLILNFLQMLIPQTLAKRVISMALIAAGLPNGQVTELTGLCDRSVCSLRKALETGEAANLFYVGGGSGKSKIAGYEAAIVEEIESGSYNNRQQIADMIQERYGIKVCLNTISNLLKKRHQTS